MKNLMLSLFMLTAGRLFAQNDDPFFLPAGKQFEISEFVPNPNSDPYEDINYRDSLFCLFMGAEIVPREEAFALIQTVKFVNKDEYSYDNYYSVTRSRGVLLGQGFFSKIDFDGNGTKELFFFGNVKGTEGPAAVWELDSLSGTYKEIGLISGYPVDFQQYNTTSETGEISKTTVLTMSYFGCCADVNGRSHRLKIDRHQGKWRFQITDKIRFAPQSQWPWVLDLRRPFKLKKKDWLIVSYQASDDGNEFDGWRSFCKDCPTNGIALYKRGTKGTILSQHNYKGKRWFFVGMQPENIPIKTIFESKTEHTVIYGWLPAESVQEIKK